MGKTRQTGHTAKQTSKPAPAERKSHGNAEYLAGMDMVTDALINHVRGVAFQEPVSRFESMICALPSYEKDGSLVLPCDMR